VSVKAKTKPTKPAARAAAPARPVVKPASASKAAAPSKASSASKTSSAKKTTTAAPAKNNNELRSILEDLRVRTLKEIKEKVKSGTSATSQEIGDMYDQASEERDRELDLLLGDRERGKLMQIDEAFLRLKEGTYGQCEECGEPINPKRLRIVPFTRTCVDCQTDKENEERLMRDRDGDGEKIYTVATSDAPASTDEDD
jgi:DnaK suppressor protein